MSNRTYNRLFLTLVALALGLALAPIFMMQAAVDRKADQRAHFIQCDTDSDCQDKYGY